VLKKFGDLKFRFSVEGINKKITQSEQIRICKLFGHLPFNQSLVDLRNY
jgi:tRNA (guanine10-N2)-methyltransferase